MATRYTESGKTVAKLTLIYGEELIFLNTLKPDLQATESAKPDRKKTFHVQYFTI